MFGTISEYKYNVHIPRFVKTSQGRSHRGVGGRVPPGWEEFLENQPQKQGKSGKMGQLSTFSPVTWGLFD